MEIKNGNGTGCIKLITNQFSRQVADLTVSDKEPIKDMEELVDMAFDDIPEPSDSDTPF